MDGIIRVIFIFKHSPASLFSITNMTSRNVKDVNTHVFQKYSTQDVRYVSLIINVFQKCFNVIKNNTHIYLNLNRCKPH